MKKRILSFVLALCMLIGVITIVPMTVNATEPEPWDGTVATGFAGGTGSAATPYQIATAGQLAYMAKFINEDASAANAALHYELTADIVINTGDAADFAATPTVKKSDPIGYYKSGADEAGVRANLFCGTFEGNGHTISGMYINEDRSAAPISHVGVGMFAMAKGATIRNFALVNTYICARDQVGSIVGLLSAGVNGKIEKIYSDAIIDYGTYDEGGTNGAGGIAGHGTNDGGVVAITNCVFAGSIKAAGAGAGILGHANGKGFNISNCLNLGPIVSGNYAGGIVGRNAGSGKLTISKCINIGGISGSNTATISYNTSGYATVSEIYVITTGRTCRYARIDGSGTTTNSYTVSAANSINDFMGTDATVTITGWTKRANDIMVPTEVASLVPNLYTKAVWNNWDNTELYSTYYRVGTTPEYVGETPTRPQSGANPYIFLNFTGPVSSGNAQVYTAQFTDCPAWLAGYFTGQTEFTITTAEQLKDFAFFTNTVFDGSHNFAGKTVKLGANISNVGAFTPIGHGSLESGSSATYFAGTFDGQGYTISGITVNETENFNTGGLFVGLCDSAVVKDFALINTSVKATAGSYTAGGVIGEVRCTGDGGLSVSGIYCDATVESAGGSASGIVGRLGGTKTIEVTISDCVFAGSAITTGEENINGAAGILGNGNGMTATITNCLNTGTIYANYRYAGGILGRTATNPYITISNCVNTGSIDCGNTPATYAVAIAQASSSNVKVGYNYVVSSDRSYNRCIDSEGAAVDSAILVGTEELIGNGADVLTLTGWTKDADDIIRPTAAKVPANAVLYKSGTLYGASVRLGTPTGLRFSGVLSKAYLDSLIASYGESNVKYGIIITPEDYLTDNDFTMAALDADTTITGMKYAKIEAVTTANAATAEADGYYRFNGVLSKVQEGNYERAFAARVYIQITTGTETEYIYAGYSEADNARSIKAVSEAALNDLSDTQTGAYQHEIDVDGVTKYSRFTEDDRAVLNGFFTVGTQP